MRVSLEWLHEYVDLPLSAEELAHRLTLSTVEVESIERTGSWENVWVGEVLTEAPMPESDHLHLCTVTTGRESFGVVCGAPNVRAGQKIAYAGIGAELVDGHSGKPTRLKAARIRGHESNGMICSEKELGLSEEHEGILVLPPDAPVGTPLRDFLGDVVLVAGAWAHRADLLAMLGFARETAALTDQLVREPNLSYEAAAGAIEGTVAVDIEAPDLCARYVAGVIEGVQIGPSPDWMQRRLLAAGQRPINNVVDITNYVMLEFGQPLHGFDYDRVRDNRIIVRRGRAGERLTTLDGIERELNPEMLVIADASGPIALAGVMGGATTEIGADTTTVLLEAANFHGMNVRRTSQLLGLRSEASSRFEKQLPAELAERAARRAVQLFVRYAGGRARAGFVDNYPLPQPEVHVELTDERLRRVLGIEIAQHDVVRTLRALGFGCEPRDGGHYDVQVPYWRMDVAIQDDVVEEVIRILGFERLPGTTVSGRVPEYVPQPARTLRDRVKDALAAAGGQEIITYAAVSEDLLRKVTPAEDLAILQPLRVVNPVSNEHELMRTSIRGSMLETLAANLRHRRPALSLFETGTIYVPREDRADLPDEREVLVGALCGRRTDRWGHATGDQIDFFDAKGYVELLDRELGAGFSYAAAADPNLLDGRTAGIRVGDSAIGVVGQLHPDLLATFDIDQDVLLYELDLTALLPFVRPVRGYRPISRYPAVQHDLALVVDRDVAAADILSAIRGSKMVASAEVFDEYTGEQLGQGKKSLAISVSYQAPDRTLTDEDASREQARILRGLQRRFEAQLRG